MQPERFIPWFVDFSSEDAPAGQAARRFSPMPTPHACYRYPSGLRWGGVVDVRLSASPNGPPKRLAQEGKARADRWRPAYRVRNQGRQDAVDEGSFKDIEKFKADLGGGRQPAGQLEVDLQRLLHAGAGHHLPAPCGQPLRGNSQACGVTSPTTPRLQDSRPASTFTTQRLNVHERLVTLRRDGLSLTAEREEYDGGLRA